MLGGQAENVEQFGHVGRVTVERAVLLEDLADPQLGRQRARLELHADDLVDPVRVGVRVEAEQPDRAGVRPPQPDSALMAVVFPAPFGPKMPKISPSATVNETSSTATSAPYVLRRCATSTAGGRGGLR